MKTPNRGRRRGTEPKSQKACKFAPFEADEGTRTPDLASAQSPVAPVRHPRFGEPECEYAGNRCRWTRRSQVH